MAFLQAAANRQSGGYNINNSLKFEADNSEYLSKTPQTAGNRKTWTISVWVKRTELSSGGHMIFSAGDTYVQFDGNAIWCNFRAASENFFLATTRLFRDTSAWYHIVVQCDTTQGTASNRAKLYVNGVQETSLQNDTYGNMSQNYDTSMNNTIEHEMGKYSKEETTYANFFNGYMADFHLVDGTALSPTSFGKFDENGIWIPIGYSGHGSQGSKLTFENSANLGFSSSATSYIATNITAADQATDTPTNSFATFNTLYNYDGVVINEGATKTTNENTANFRSVVSNIAVQNGKWYAEFTAGSNTGFVGVGLVEEMTGSLPKTQYLGQLGESISYYAYQGQILHGGSAQSTTGTFAGYGAGDVIGIALDKTNGFVYWHKNGTYQNSGDPTSGATGTGGIALSLGYSGYAQSDYYFMGYAQSSATAAYANFGGYTAASISSAATDANGYGTFEYAPPTGYYALCTKNLAEFGG